LTLVKKVTALEVSGNGNIAYVAGVEDNHDQRHHNTPEIPKIYAVSFDQRLRYISSVPLTHQKYLRVHKLKRIKGEEVLLAGCNKHFAVVEYHDKVLREIGHVHNAHSSDIVDFELVGKNLYSRGVQESDVKVTTFGIRKERDTNRDRSKQSLNPFDDPSQSSPPGETRHKSPPKNLKNKNLNVEIPSPIEENFPKPIKMEPQATSNQAIPTEPQPQKQDNPISSSKHPEPVTVQHLPKQDPPAVQQPIKSELPKAEAPVVAIKPSEPSQAPKNPKQESSVPAILQPQTPKPIVFISSKYEVFKRHKIDTSFIPGKVVSNLRIP